MLRSGCLALAHMLDATQLMGWGWGGVGFLQEILAKFLDISIGRPHALREDVAMALIMSTSTLT